MWFWQNICMKKEKAMRSLKWSGIIQLAKSNIKFNIMSCILEITWY